MIRLALPNPLKNLLFGTDLPTVSSVGGILGSILKGIGVGHSGGKAKRHHVGRVRAEADMC